ncbi:MAG: CRISPR-associated endonuclease Cas1 [Anaerolineales bacterium]|nr:CRISPR-associated endonuclease Cas1 [Anaerolineales bacterium]
MPTLYITEPGAQVCKADERLIVKKGDEILEEIPIIKVDQVVLMGRGVSLTTAALHCLTRRGVDIVYLTGAGRYLSRVVGQEHKHGKLRHRQALAVSDPAFAMHTARSIVRGKVLNQRTLVQRHAERAPWAGRALAGMDEMARRAEEARNLEELRGLEGQAAKEYFSLFRRLLRPPSGGGSWGFERRAYYPPTDPINALLSFSYSMLLRDMTTACALIGLDPYLGFFHAIDYGRPSMALDLMEEFRPVIADSVVLEAVNRPFVSLANFEAVDLSEEEAEKDENTPPRSGTQAVYLGKEGRDQVILLYENRVNQNVLHPATGDQVLYRYVFQLQAQQMAALLLGERTQYVPFTIR